VIASPSFGRLVGIVLLLVATSVGALAADGDAPSALPSDGGMAAKLQPFLDDHVIAGAVVLVADKDKVLDLEAVGYNDLATKQAMKTTDLFYIASMTKTFTTAGLMMLVDEGKVKLDDPVEKYLPEFKGQMVQEAGGQPHPPKHPITVREIMSHTAGLHKGPLPGDTLEKYVKELAKRPLEFEPGTKFIYSPGPAVGGRIIEVVSGIPYTQYLQQRLLDPLGLKETTFWPDAELASRLALTHKYNRTSKTLEPLGNSSKHGENVPPRIASQFGGSVFAAYRRQFGNPAGGLFSTATDVGRFCQMLLNGGTYEGKRYLSAAAVKEMSSLQTGRLTVGREEGYGLGCFVQERATAGGPSVGSFGHHGARKTQMWIDPQNRLIMVLMVQCAELDGRQQTDLYAAYRQQAIARYGKTSPQDLSKP
jgi:CubicO group peptidase (beta-lactamase class C family)